MNKTSINTFRIGVVTVIATLSFVAYDLFFTQHASAVEEVAPVIGLSDSDSAVIAKINTIELNTAIFTNPAFLSLVNYNVTLSPETAGKDNPFAPLHVVQAPVTKTTKTTSH